ncbi:hypothetical protein TVNIR_0294 [Thioalkalivibrio nitratireducens DSM 14787]|uniref:DUF4426 domain-containing protein n=1 Tax=Thioalkalivibrio nitratireducens (strain DSM 14787 / UNIQEM 213 / ALEN2) TaxID=1255043 RepID=L0DSP5_THIND|nr:DUF4426 domain-containing protein [Thioalkalivibrio nitratireducens]AGA32005.1 hypothetical protein TVNIR_0294 [Thioalkalivibrio nitratireducens DSM 14787]
MTIVQPTFVALLGIVLGTFLGVGSAHAEEVDFDSHVVHYSVVNTTFLSPEVARAYDVRRSRGRALVNIVVMERDGDDLHPVSVSLSGRTVNLSQQVRSLEFREVHEGDAIYHLAEVRVRPAEVLDFSVQIRAAGAAQPMLLNFRQAVFAH